MPRHVHVPAETVDTMLAGVAAGHSLAAMCRTHQLARGTVGDKFARDPLLAERFSEARAAGKDVRASRPRRRRAAAPAAAAQPNHGTAVGPPSLIAPRPPVAATAPAAGQSSRIPVAHVVGDIVYLDMAGVVGVLGQILGSMADVAAQAEPRR